MEGKIFFVVFVSILTSFVHSSVLTNLCPGTPSCNCILTNDTNLDIICTSTPNLTALPTLATVTLQINVTLLRVSSSTTGTAGPLIRLPTNICSSYPNIAILDLSSNNINGFVNTSELACLGSNLIGVNFSNNYITGIETNFFISNRKLQSIDFSSNYLTTMPMIDGANYVSFSSTLILMNFSSNQITKIDLWPLFVKTQNSMTIDMSNNSINNITNQIPILIKQLTQTPDPRNLYLNNNQLDRVSDLLLEQYGACSTISKLSTSYFIVGISNILLDNNPLICDCQSYYLIKYINNHIDEFPQISSGAALLTKAKCTSPSETVGQQYIFSNFSASNSCVTYTLPSTADIFCSVYTNETNSTLSPPTYWPSTATTILTTISNTYGNDTATNSAGNVASDDSSGANGSSKSASPSWYIILGIVLGLALILFLLMLGCFLCKDRLLPKTCRSKLLNHGDDLKNSYEQMIRNSETSSQTAFRLNGIKPRRTSISTSTCGVDDSNLTSSNDHNSWNDTIHPAQETQTCFQIIRPKPSTDPSSSTRNPQRLRNDAIVNNSRRERKLSLSTTTDVATHTANVVKGIPISSVPSKIPSIFPNVNDTSISELSVTSIPLTPSKRAKLLPPVKSGMYVDSKNDNLLNTSAGSFRTSQIQRRRSSMWHRKRHQNIVSPPPTRPASVKAQKTIFNHDGFSTEEIISIPTIESLTNKSSKPLRTLPLLNITVVPAWIDDNTD